MSEIRGDVAAGGPPGGLPDELARLFADALPQLAWLARPDGAIFWCNRRWHEYTGTTPEQMAGWGWQQVHRPANLPDVVERWRRSIATGETFEMELLLRGADGAFRPFLTRGVPVRDPGGEVRYWIGTNTDISQQKQVEQALIESRERYNESETALRLALDAAYLIAFVWDIPRNEVRRYHDAAKVLGRTDERPDTIEDVRARVHPEDRALFDRNVQAALRDGTYASEFRLLGTDGLTRWLHELGRVEFDPAGKPLRLTGLSQDITDRKQTELRLLEAQQQLQRHAAQLESAVAERTARLQELVSELGSFAYSISHDLRAPLRSIQGFAELLREEAGGQLPESARGYLERVIRAAHRMDALILDVLEYSRITRAELNLEDVELGEVVRTALETHEHFRATGAKIEVQDPLPLVRASRPALLQVLSNLLVNAVKFVTPGVQPQVRVWAQAADAVVRLWVEDNGIGIAPKDQEKIWGMLERLNPSFEGTGVGLSIVRKAVERMGGRVGVESASGQGSRFWIELPKVLAAPKPLVDGSDPALGA